MSEIRRVEFISILANWKKFKQLRDKTSRPFKEEFTNRDELLKYVEDLYDQVISGAYMPSPPRAYNLIEKGDGTSRIVPLLELKDLLIYRFCTMSLEQIIAVNRVPDTFGGWSMGGIIRSVESAELDEVDSRFNDAFDEWLNDLNEDIEYAGFATISPEHWIKSWKLYQRIAYIASEDYPDGTFLQLDLANFYDSIRLDRLESLLRSEAHTEQQPIINLLFIFLRFWNRLQEGYTPKTVGIPQDESGDSSRLLANYFLQDYDSHMYGNAEAIGAKYIRFADDQMIIGQREYQLKRLVYNASVYLRSIGLSLNGSKTKYDNLEEFRRRWAFELHKDFEINRLQVAEELVSNNGKAVYEWRWESLLKRLLKKGISEFPKALRTELLELITTHKFLGQLSSYHFIQLHNDLDSDEWQGFLEKLMTYLTMTMSNQTHLSFIKAMKELEDVYLVDKVEALEAERTLERHITSFKNPLEDY